VTEVRPKVLLVDDVEANLVSLEAVLGNLDCDLLRASNGNEALRQLLKHDFAAMLLDVQMPDMDGYEVARYARENPQTREVPIIFVTATHETRENVLLGYDAGAFDLLFKPIDPYVLRSKVQVFLQLYTSRRELRAEIDAHRRTLAESEAFSYSVSHDLRAPLRSIDGFSQALLEDHAANLDAKGQDYLRRVRGAAQRMGELIDDLLALSRVSRAAVRAQAVDLSVVARDIADELARRDPDRAVDVAVEAGLTTDADSRLVRVLLENLMGNAWKFTMKAPAARIEIGATRQTDEQVFFVRDNGAGFSMSYAHKLFRPFQRLHAETEFPGTGIGLATVHRIVDRHGGRVWAEGAVNAGATIYFTLAKKAGPRS
jgi:two-component system sensor histidine kinase/response regulator